MLMLPRCQTAMLGQGSAPQMAQASAPAHSAGLILLWVHAHEKVKSVPTTRIVPGSHGSAHLAAMPNLLMAAGHRSEEISACRSMVRTFISCLEVLTTLMLESLTSQDQIISRSK